jgi:hypothetical protein
VGVSAAEVEEGRGEVEDGERGSEDKDTGTPAEGEDVVIDSATPLRVVSLSPVRELLTNWGTILDGGAERCW